MEQDVIIHRTRTRFKFIDRIKILLGGEVITTSEITTGHKHCIIKGAWSKAHVNSRLFNWIATNMSSTKTKKGLLISNVDTQANEKDD